MEINQLVIDAIRMLSVDAIQAANSGHPGMALGSTPMMYTLWDRHLRIDRADADWINRDRFVLSAGHASAMLYSFLHLYTDHLSLEDIKEFRQNNSKTPGHPEYGHTKGVDVTTGPLGGGIATAVGLAIAQTHLANKYNTKDFELFNNFTYVLVGDGCLMEGVASEASSLAGSLSLANLIVLYDSNNITIEGDTDLSFKEDVRKRYEAYGFETFLVEDGNDIEKIDDVIKLAKVNKNKPSFIEVRTKIGYGSHVEGTAAAHGAPLGSQNIENLKEKISYPSKEPFYIPRIVYEYCEIEKKEKHHEYLEWKEMYSKYKLLFPNKSKLMEEEFAPLDIASLLNNNNLFEFNSRSMSTRVASGIVLNKLNATLDNIIGGSADLSPSTMTHLNGEESYSEINREGKNLHFGIRENAMAAVGNGLVLYGGLRAFVSTFFVFSDFLKPMLRLSSLMNLPLIYVLTHDSIGVGEDGPTHQPVEQLTMLRSQPNLYTFRPADAIETAYSWIMALTINTAPSALVLSRQDIPILNSTSEEALKGGYILKEVENPDIIIIASGSEVSLALDVSSELNKNSINAQVVSMPCLELFEEQEQEYINHIIPSDFENIVVIEAASQMSWGKYVGRNGLAISLDTFGSSGKNNELFEKYGFTTSSIIKRIVEQFSLQI